MSQKTLFVILFAALLIIGGFFLAALFISRVEDKPLGEVLREVSPFGDIVGDSGPGLRPSTGGGGGKGEGASPATATKAGGLPKLYKISAEPVSGAVSFTRDVTEYVRYALLDSGHIY